jgi:beta-phosphoglucomutase-like phosphatase (HAD superfamily)
MSKCSAASSANGGRALLAAYAERVGLMVEAGFHQSLAAIEGVAEVLLATPFCVASSSSPEQIRHQTGFDRPAAPVWGIAVRRTMVARDKPRPTFFCDAAQRLTTSWNAVSSSRTAPQVSMPRAPPA